MQKTDSFHEPSSQKGSKSRSSSSGSSSSSSEDPQVSKLTHHHKETFYTEGTQQLQEARLAIALSSVERAQRRLGAGAGAR